MDPLLAVLALISVLCLGGIVALFFRLRTRVRADSDYHRAAAIHKFPQRLTLRWLVPFAWRKQSRGPRRVEAFETLGFQKLGGFSVEELGGARLFVLQHPTTGLLGVVNEHEQLGTWSDVLIFIKGETQPILASSILRHVHFFLLPGSPKIHKHRATEEELAKVVLKAAGSEAVALRVTIGEFGQLYEEAFADSVDRRLLEPLEDGEMRRIVREQLPACCEGQVSEAEFARIKRQYPRALANELRLVCAAQFLRETTLPASQWQDARQRLLIVHEKTPLHELAAQKLIYGAYLTETLKGMLRRLKGKNQSPRQGFANLNFALPAFERYKKLGEVARPVPADIYCAPTPRGRI